MRLQLHTDYALRTLLYLAATGAERARVADIAAAYGISHMHLLKVANKLAHLGYVEATRGRGGGLRLARAPASIRVGEVVRSFEGPEGVLPCVTDEDGECTIHAICSLRHALGEAERAFYSSLDRYTIAQLTRNRTALVALLRSDPTDPR